METQVVPFRHRPVEVSLEWRQLGALYAHVSDGVPFDASALNARLRSAEYPDGQLSFDLGQLAHDAEVSFHGFAEHGDSSDDAQLTVAFRTPNAAPTVVTTFADQKVGSLPQLEVGFELSPPAPGPVLTHLSITPRRVVGRGRVVVREAGPGFRTPEDVSPYVPRERDYISVPRPPYRDPAFESLPVTPPAPAQARVDSEYLVWYGTNRKPGAPRGASATYTAQRDTEIHYGYCRVFVPASHVTGSAGKGWWRRLITPPGRPRDHPLKVLFTAQLVAADFWTSISDWIEKVEEGQRTGVVYLHGFANSFISVATRAAQLGFDLSINPLRPMAFFSWPSQGTMKVPGYMTDEETIRVSQDAIESFLIDFARKSGCEEVHVIAHSMGNRALANIMRRLADSAAAETGVRFGQVVLAAPDIDVDEFNKFAAAYGAMARRTTLYVSSKDRALELSKKAHTYPRVGLLPPVTVVPGIDTVDVADVDMSVMGHSYVAELAAVVGDMSQLINSNEEPDRRYRLRPSDAGNGKRYWVIRA